MAGTGMSTTQCADTCWDSPREPPPALGLGRGQCSAAPVISRVPERHCWQQECVKQFLVQLS